MKKASLLKWLCAAAGLPTIALATVGSGALFLGVFYENINKNISYGSACWGNNIGNGSSADEWSGVGLGGAGNA